ncbi:MAG TPA: ligand-binding protein SH3, partial [Propionibacteriaceae bacterium]|nr:ligand-binding protein SH3 [Propionibacteriaceae bacterium]
AIDVMIPNYRSNVELGTQIRDYFQANASKYHVRYIIYRQHIWTVASAAKGWRYMADRGGDTANHMDHVHISVYAN